MKPSFPSLLLCGLLALGLSRSDAAISIQASNVTALTGSSGNTFDVVVASSPTDSPFEIAAFSVDLHFLPFNLGIDITGVSQAGVDYIFDSSLETLVELPNITNNGHSVNFGDVILSQNTSATLAPGDSALLGRVTFDVDIAAPPGTYDITLTGPPPGGLSQLDDFNGDPIPFNGSVAQLNIVPEPSSALLTLLSLGLLYFRRQR